MVSNHGGRVLDRVL
ncbi:MAG: hypothetical protein ACLU9S_11190 [Oscillospiraceae bacterium]